MQYFYMRTEKQDRKVIAQIGGLYRDDILLSLLPQEGETCLVHVKPSTLSARALNLKTEAEEIADNVYATCGAEKVRTLIQRYYGLAKALSREQAHLVVFDSERPPENFDAQDPQGAHAVLNLNTPAGNIVQVPDESRLRPVVSRALRKLMGGYLSRTDMLELAKKAETVLSPAVDAVLQTASQGGLTVNNFPGPYPGLCTLWFVRGMELTLAHRTALAQNLPEELDIGEITLGEDWSVTFREKSPATPGMFASYLRIGVTGAKAACGCITLLASGALSIIPAAIYGGQWWFLPLGFLGGAIVLSVGSAFFMRWKRTALAELRREKNA
jgi:hypothetical protein